MRLSKEIVECFVNSSYAHLGFNHFLVVLTSSLCESAGLWCGLTVRAAWTSPEPSLLSALHKTAFVLGFTIPEDAWQA